MLANSFAPWSFSVAAFALAGVRSSPSPARPPVAAPAPRKNCRRVVLGASIVRAPGSGRSVLVARRPGWPHATCRALLLRLQALGEPLVGHVDVEIDLQLLVRALDREGMHVVPVPLVRDEGLLPLLHAE